MQADLAAEYGLGWLTRIAADPLFWAPEMGKNRVSLWFFGVDLFKY
jgi:hypothetical protein